MRRSIDRKAYWLSSIIVELSATAAIVIGRAAYLAAVVGVVGDVVKKRSRAGYKSGLAQSICHCQRCNGKEAQLPAARARWLTIKKIRRRARKLVSRRRLLLGP